MDNQFHLLPYFPRLLRDGFAVTSPTDSLYNCSAWAAGDTARWWEPAEDGYWPEGVIREVSLSAFLQAYSTLGFAPCADGDFQQGFEKIAIYSNAHGPQHAARQLSDGSWTSKLGPHEDIAHSKHRAVEGDVYGSVVQFLKRAV